MHRFSGKVRYLKHYNAMGAITDVYTKSWGNRGMGRVCTFSWEREVVLEMGVKE